jgi:hypothetical protein
MSYPVLYGARMTKNPLIVSGPYSHENLAIFLFHGAEEIDGSGYTSLTEAFEKKHVLVHETGTVGQLEVENLSETLGDCRPSKSRLIEIRRA